MNKLLKELVKAFILGVIVFLVYSLILYINGNLWYGVNGYTFFFQTQLYSISLYLVNSYVFGSFMERFKDNFWTLQRITFGLFTGVMATFLTVFLLRFFLIVLIEGESVDQFLENEKLSHYYLSIIISLIATALFYAFYYWKRKQETNIKEAKIIAGTASAKFDALKNQLDPHFLFNSLNVLTSLIDENPMQAQKFTTSLSKVYRYVLEQKNKQLVSVDEELAFAKTYMNLIKMRFEDSIIFEMPEKANNPEAKVVPLSLQLLLENAVKHNMVTPTRKLHITIHEQDGALIIKNNKQPKQVVKKSSGVGLQNIKQRYNLLTDRRVNIIEEDGGFSVAIPMLTKQQPMAEVQEIYIEDKKYSIAKEKVEKIKGFYIHFTIYIIMVPVFIWINAISTSFPWAMFPILGWGFGVAGHASEAFEWHPIFNKKWEDRKIQELMDDDDF